ncbi:MAG: M28 family peptidase [Clostridiales bacterium]|nr:M28 family peptidase [Clostridiales bacterium]
MKAKLFVLFAVAAMLLVFVVPQALTAETVGLTPHEEQFLAALDYDHVDYLAHYISEDIGNRITFSPRRDMCVDWIMDELESYGYDPYIQEFTWTSTPTSNGIIWIDGKHYVYYGPTWAATSVYRYDSREELKITGTAVVNWANSANAFVLPDGDYSGKAVFVTLNGSFPSGANAYNAALALQTAGAAAVMFQTLPMAANGNTTYSRLGSITSGTNITIPVGTTLNYETAGMLASLNASTAVTIKLFSNNVGKNVIAELPSASGSDKTVYITSHHDTTGSGPGLNDNGSGTIMTLEMARAFRDWNFEYNIVFIIFDAEESGLRGAYAYCAEMSQQERADFVANYNMDMIATSQANCEWMFMNISDTRLQTLQNQITNNNVALADNPAAVAIAKEYDVYNTTMLAAEKLDFTGNILFCYDTTTDHYAFVRYGNGNYDNHRNMMNAVEYDWRSNRRGTGFETLYHRAGDNYALNFSLQRCQRQSDIISLAIYYGAKGDYDLQCRGIVEDVAVAPGGTVNVRYSIENNTLGFSTLAFDLPYDKNIYEPVAVTASGALTGTDRYLVYNLAFEGNDILRVAFSSGENVTGDTILFTVSYKVKEDAPPLDMPLAVNVVQAKTDLETGFNDLDLKFNTATLVIGILGDVDGDGKITPEDAIVLLQMYVGIVEWTPRALLLGDVNKDGVVDPVDAALILRMVVGG